MLKTNRTRLGLEALEAREVPATLFWAKQTLAEDETYYPSTSRLNWSTQPDLIENPADPPGANDILIFNDLGNANCDLIATSVGAIQMQIFEEPETSWVNIRTSGPLVVQGVADSYIGSNWDAGTNLYLRGDLTFHDKTVWIDGTCDMKTYDGPHNIIIDTTATVRISGRTAYDGGAAANQDFEVAHNFVNYGVLQVENHGSILYPSLLYTNYIYNTATFNWKGGTVGNIATEKFYVENVGTPAKVETSQGVDFANCTLLGGFYNRSDADLYILTGQLSVYGYLTRDGVTASVYSNGAQIIQRTGTTLKVRKDIVLQTSTYSLKDPLGDLQQATISSIDTWETEFTRLALYQSTMDLASNWDHGERLDVVGSNNTVVFTGSALKVGLAGSAIDSIKCRSFDARTVGGFASCCYVTAFTPVPGGIWTVVDAAASGSIYDFGLWSLPTGVTEQLIEGLNDLRLVKIAPGGD